MKLHDSLMGQFEVVHALILRETLTRFGGHKLGYMWALVEPILMILTFYALFAMVGRSAPTGMTLFSFITTGICPYLVFANTVSQVANSINGNKALLFYPQVNPLDIVAARVFLEFSTYTVVFLVLLSVEALFTQHLTVSDPLLVLGAFFLASFLGGSLGLVFLSLGQLSNAVDRARGPLMRPFFWISGIFFTTAGIPPDSRQLVLWNPVLNIVELCRAGWFIRYDDSFANTLYVFTWAIGLFLAGLLLERGIRRRIEVT